MEHKLSDLVSAKNEMILKGQIVEAVEKHFASDAVTMDFDGTATKSKAELVDKMKGFTGAIAKVNGIKLHHSATEGNVSLSEFTFNFEMKDGSKILWHEVIRAVWKDGKIVDEEYFKG